ncbi:hypothetical protein [Candidatus Manganitrophus noduliformans]|uniref:Lipoprotein n=1 Tax=Candidatus Manganitrophus noduliformans TaxID=2606439 RepID=A0A7X6DP35_9BACT|nr:hypothetical protein [Candidatus Manganitrophus noduliformans]NKE70783.1 hypothetical protein [Candidatus Manganitrophus noduliformans]
MNIRSKVKSASMAVILLLLFTGCASFSRNQLPNAANLLQLSENNSKPTASYSFSSGIDLFGKQEHQENVRKKLEDEFISVFRESGYFASLTPGGQAEMNIEVRLVNSGTPAAMIPAMITGFSLYTIPSWATDHYTVTAKVTTQDGKEHIYELTDAMTTVQWLPMILVFPFQNMVNVSKQVRQNIWKNLILKMQKDGVLSQNVPVGQTDHLVIQFEWSFHG